MNDSIYNLAKKVRPDLEGYSGQQRMSATSDVLTLVYIFPLAVMGVAWLIRVSDWGSIRKQWMVYLMMGVILYIFNRLRFFFITEIRTGGYANSDGAMDGIAVWAAVLILGPTALWLKVAWDVLIFLSSIYKERTTQSYWNRGRMFLADLSSDSLATLIALTVYARAGGATPIHDISLASIVPAFLAIVVQFFGTVLVYSGYIAYVVWSLKNVLHTPTRPALSFFGIALILPALANPFGIVAAGMFVTEGIWAFVYI
jgi:hypothetical protein